MLTTRLGGPAVPRVPLRRRRERRRLGPRLELRRRASVRPSPAGEHSSPVRVRGGRGAG